MKYLCNNNKPGMSFLKVKIQYKLSSLNFFELW